MGKSIAILQSNFLPWRGYFELINSVDEFILFDTVQFTKRDWRNRNLIKTQNGAKWITVPVDTKNGSRIPINEILVDQENWRIPLWARIENAYRCAPFYADIEELTRKIIFDTRIERLSDLNKTLLEKICKYLDITTPIIDAPKIDAPQNKNSHLIDICKKREATEYLSGPSASVYINNQEFEKAGIELNWHMYSNHVEYKQPWGSFIENLSIIDILMNNGPESRNVMGLSNLGSRS